MVRRIVKVKRVKVKPNKRIGGVVMETTRRSMSPMAHARMIMQKTMKEKGLTSEDVNKEFAEIRYGKKI